MFNKNDIKMYNYMKDEMEGFINFFNNEFSKKEENKLILNFNDRILKIIEIKDFVCVITNGEGLPFCKIDFINNTITTISVNEFSVDNIISSIEKSYVNGKHNLQKRQKSIFIGKKTKKEISNIIKVIDDKYVKLLEETNSYNTVTVSAYKLVIKALEEYNKRHIKLENSYMFIRSTDLDEYRKKLHKKSTDIITISDIVYEKIKEEI